MIDHYVAAVIAVDQTKRRFAGSRERSLVAELIPPPPTRHRGRRSLAAALRMAANALEPRVADHAR